MSEEKNDKNQKDEEIAAALEQSEEQTAQTHSMQEIHSQNESMWTQNEKLTFGNEEVVQTEPARENEEQKEDVHILELSAEMLVDVKEEKAKKKAKKKKEEKTEKSGLDILLDYSSQKDENEEKHTVKKEEKLVQLSFFPLDEKDEKNK